MKVPPKRPNVQINDPAAALRNAQKLGQQILSVPKSEIDAAAEREKAAKKSSKRT